MAFVPWSTPVAGTVLTAARWIQDIRDNLNAWFPLAATSGVAWTSYTPTLTQSATVTKTVTYAKYTQIGKTIICKVHLTCTGSGTSNNAVIVGLPVTASLASNGFTVGDGDIVTTVHNTGTAQLASTTTVAFMDNSQATANLLGQTGSVFSAALANTNVVSMNVFYEAA